MKKLFVLFFVVSLFSCKSKDEEILSHTTKQMIKEESEDYKKVCDELLLTKLENHRLKEQLFDDSMRLNQLEAGFKMLQASFMMSQADYNDLFNTHQKLLKTLKLCDDNVVSLLKFLAKQK